MTRPHRIQVLASREAAEEAARVAEREGLSLSTWIYRLILAELAHQSTPGPSPPKGAP